MRLIEESRRCLLVSHARPDGDAVGSLIAMAAVLRGLGKKVAVRNVHLPPTRYLKLAGAKGVRPARAGRLPAADTAIALDCATIERSGVAGDLARYPVLLNIDHHVSNTRYGTACWVDAEASSTGEMLLRLVLARGWPLPPAARDALYAAIYTDTGRFSFSNTSPDALRMAAELVERGVRPDRMYRMIHCSRAKGDLELEAAARASMRVTAGGRIASISLTLDDFRRTGTTTLDAEDFPQIPMQMDGVELGVFVYELDKASGGGTKVSLRSAGSVDVSRLAVGFDGGGHPRAAGCELPLPLGATLRKIIAAAKGALGKAR